MERKNLITTFMSTNDSDVLTPYGKYLIEYAKNHGISVSEASEECMCKARLDYFNATGK